jgi:hypothetical protein
VLWHAGLAKGRLALPASSVVSAFDQGPCESIGDLNDVSLDINLSLHQEESDIQPAHSFVLILAGRRTLLGGACRNLLVTWWLRHRN